MRKELVHKTAFVSYFAIHIPSIGPNISGFFLGGVHVARGPSLQNMILTSTAFVFTLLLDLVFKI